VIEVKEEKKNVEGNEGRLRRLKSTLQFGYLPQLMVTS